MNRLIFTALIFATSFAHARYQNCDAAQEGAIEAALSLAPAQIAKLKESIALELDPKTRRDNYDEKTITKLRKAHKKLACIAGKMNRLNFKCTNESNFFTAQTLPIVGKQVKLANRFFNMKDVSQSAALVHEASHKCATNDAFYFGGAVKSFNDIADKNYQNTGASYDAWIEDGFCVPGYNCK